MEILATEVVSEMHGWGYAFLIVGFLVAGLGLALLNLSDTGDEMAISALIAVTGLAVIFLLSDADAKEYEQHTVIIHDYNEVREQGFEIVEEQGKLTIVREMEAE